MLLSFSFLNSELLAQKKKLTYRQVYENGMRIPLSQHGADEKVL